MSSFPTWAVWSIVVPLVLLSPILAFLSALAIEMLVWAVVDVGAPAGVALSAGTAALFLLRKLSMGSAPASKDVY